MPEHVTVGWILRALFDMLVVLVLMAILLASAGALTAVWMVAILYFMAWIGVPL